MKPLRSCLKTLKRIAPALAMTIIGRPVFAEQGDIVPGASIAKLLETTKFREKNKAIEYTLIKIQHAWCNKNGANILFGDNFFMSGNRKKGGELCIYKHLAINVNKLEIYHCHGMLQFHFMTDDDVLIQDTKGGTIKWITCNMTIRDKSQRD